VHCDDEHLPFTHAKVQQSVFTAQDAPASRHTPPSDVHRLVAGSHEPRQQVSVDVHAIPTGKQLIGTPPTLPTPPDDASGLPAPPAPPVLFELLSDEHAAARPIAATRQAPRIVPNFMRFSVLTGGVTHLGAVDSTAHRPFVVAPLSRL
jgi:hypothetical protein